jgi:hypothetical protein
MWRHFFRQLLGLPVGGPYSHVKARLYDHNVVQVAKGGRWTLVRVTTETVGRSRVSSVWFNDSMTEWNDGSPVSEDDRRELLSAVSYWLKTQGNQTQVR